MAEKLKIISLAGMADVTMNLIVYEYADDIIVVDVGMTFPDDDMYGIDLVIPDVSYLIENRDKIRAIFLTHGHEDHIGALPYALRYFQAPIYATPMTIGLVEHKLDEHKLLDTVELNECRAGDIVKAGRFSVEFIHANHSVVDAVCFAIRTPVGTIVHTGDFKIDPTPIWGEMIDLTRLGELGREGVLAMLADSTNAERHGFTASESDLARSYENQFRGCTERIIVTMFASNVDRLQTIINVAARNGRKVAVTGRSMETYLRVARERGYLTAPDGITLDDVVIDYNRLKTLPKDQICILTTGSQGEEGSALYRISYKMHKQVEIQPGDRVIIAANPIPGNERKVSDVVNRLCDLGADVVEHSSSNLLHASGHACDIEMKIIQALVRPKYFIPVHGGPRYRKAHKALAEQVGTPAQNVLIVEDGRIIELTAETARLGGKVTSGRVFVDGYGVGDVGSVVLRDRKHLAEDGMIVVVASMSGVTGELATEPEIITRGFVYVKESEELMEELRQVVLDILHDCEQRGLLDWSSIKSAIRGELSHYLYKKTKRNPMILPVIMEV